MEFIGTCVSRDISTLAKQCKRRLNKVKFNRMVKKEYPDLYEELGLKYYNPYNYYQSDKYYCLVHSGIEYLFTKGE